MFRARFDQALAARCAALLAPDDEAPALFRRSLELHTQEMPFEVGRTHLLFGERLRRMGERRQARVELREALIGVRVARRRLVGGAMSP